jgi:hypothetical protein
MRVESTSPSRICGRGLPLRPEYAAVLLLASQGQHRIGSGSPPGWRCRGCESQQQHGDGGKCKHHGIEWADGKQEGTQELGYGYGSKQAEDAADGGQFYPRSKDDRNHPRSLTAQR